MYSIYAIRNSAGRIYVGMSANVLRRLNEHNKGTVKSTRFWKPWILIHQEEVGNRTQARQIEKKLKSGFGKEFLKSLPG